MSRKNSQLDKATLPMNIVYDLYQEAFVEAPGDAAWKKKRKICATAFYRDRLEKMTAVMRRTTAKKIEEWSAGAVVNMTHELNDIFTRIIIIICFGHDCSTDLIQLEKADGTFEGITLPVALRETFVLLLAKSENLLRVFFDGFERWALSPADFRLRRNCERIR
jgi:cytochrome P450